MAITFTYRIPNSPTLSELYARYPEGGEQGWYSQLDNEKLAAWDGRKWIETTYTLITKPTTPVVTHQIEVSTPTYSPDNPRLAQLASIPVLKYLKDPASKLSDLYARYPEGGEYGWYAFVFIEKTFAWWNSTLLRWSLLSNGEHVSPDTQILTTPEQIDITTLGIYGVHLSENYEPFGISTFSMQVMPKTEDIISQFAHGIIDDQYKIWIRQGNISTGDWTAWKTISGGSSYVEPTIPAPGITTETDPLYTADKPNLQQRLRGEVTIQWLTAAPWPQGPIGAQPGDYWLRNIYGQLWRKNGHTNEFEAVDWQNNTIYRIGNSRYLHNGSYLQLISEVYQYTPPVPADSITLTADDTYTIVESTPASLLVTATGAGASIIFGTLTANKAVTISIADNSQPIAIGGTQYEAGVTIFVRYIHSTSTWSVHTILDPNIEDISDVACRAQLPTTVDVVIEAGDIFVAYVVDPSAHGSAVVNAALVPGDVVFYKGMNNQDVDANIYTIVANNTDHIYMRHVATATQIRIVRIAGDGVYYNQWDGVNENSIAFVKMGVAETGQTIRTKLEALTGDDKLQYSALRNITSSYTLDFRDDVTQIQDINIEGPIRIDDIQTVNVATLQLGAITIALPLEVPIAVAQGAYNVWTITRNTATAASVGIKYTKL